MAAPNPLALGQEIDLMLTGRGQPLHKFAVLARHVLMHKKKLHLVGLCENT